VTELRHEPSGAEKAKRSHLAVVDGDGNRAVVIAQECYDAVVAVGRVLHHTVIAADRQGSHEGMVHEGCGANPRCG